MVVCLTILAHLFFVALRISDRYSGDHKAWYAPRNWGATAAGMSRRSISLSRSLHSEPCLYLHHPAQARASADRTSKVDEEWKKLDAMLAKMNGVADSAQEPGE